jgi:hypothetical protein
MRALILLAIMALAACSTPGGPYPSLQARAAEAIDPRLPVVRPINDRPVTAALASRLTELVSQAHRGEGAFDAAASAAERFANIAAGTQTESWIVAQEALTAAIAARKPVGTALGDIDALGAEGLQKQGGLAPNDLAAIERASAEVAAIDSRQAARIDSIQKRLGS